MEDSAGVAAVRRFYDAFENQDLDQFVSVLDPGVELWTARGLRSGLHEARAWATKAESGELEQRLMVEELKENGDQVVALLRVQWWWRAEDELAEEKPVAAVFTIRNERIARWQPFEERAEAYSAGGLPEPKP